MTMSTLLRKSYLKIRHMVLYGGNPNYVLSNLVSRNFSDQRFDDHEFSNSTILVENGFNVHELPVVVRKLKDISEIYNTSNIVAPNNQTEDTSNYHLIQTEFKQCMDFRDIVSLLSKCTKITPNIALGAIERIYDVENFSDPLNTDSKSIHANLAKGAILEKLLKVVLNTEDTNTILNVLNSMSPLMESHKYKFCDELLLRTIDNKLTVKQICEFAKFLYNNKNDLKYLETIDKLWVGFVDKDKDINEFNIVQIFSILPGLKASKRTLLSLLEQKLSDLWYRINPSSMQEILNVFLEERYLTLESYAIVGRWLYTNIHALDEDSLLEIITKLTRLNYTDDHVEKAVEKYMKLKKTKMNSQILVVGILNYCMQFQICNENILNMCCTHFMKNYRDIPHSFLRSYIYPFGYLCFTPKISDKFWILAEEVVFEKFDKINAEELCSIILAYIYNGRYPIKLVSKIFNSEYLVNVLHSEAIKKLHLIDTALSIECEQYSGPLLPKNHWSDSIVQDSRIKNIINKIWHNFVFIADGADKLSASVLIPNLYSHETYMIDVMLHPVGLGSSTFNWKLKSDKNENIAILIHLPDHYCADNKKLIGPQVMRRKHLKLLGLKVVSLKYSLLSQFYTTHNTDDLNKYLRDSINNAEI